MPEQIKFKMNGVIPSVPITTLAGIASLTDLLPEMPLPTPLPQTLTNKSLLFHPRVAEEAQILLSVRDDNLVPQLITSLSQTSSDHIELKDHYANSEQPLDTEQNTPELLKAILQINPDVFKGPQYSSPRNWSQGTPLMHANQSPANYGRFSPSYSSSSGSRQTPQGSPAHPAAARTVLPPPQSGISHAQHPRMPIAPQNHADLSQMSPFAVPSPSPRATVITEQTRTSTTPQHMQDDVNCINQTLTNINPQPNIYSPAHMGSPSTPVMSVGNVTPQHHNLGPLTPQHSMHITSPMHSGMQQQQAVLQQPPPQTLQAHSMPQQVPHQPHHQLQHQPLHQLHHQPQQLAQHMPQHLPQHMPQHLPQHPSQHPQQHQQQQQMNMNQIQPHMYDPLVNTQLHNPFSNDRPIDIGKAVQDNQQFLLDPVTGLPEIDLPMENLEPKQPTIDEVAESFAAPDSSQLPANYTLTKDMLNSLDSALASEPLQQHQLNNNAARDVKMLPAAPTNEAKLKEPVVMLKRLSLADQALMQKSLSAFAEKSPTRAAKMGLTNRAEVKSESESEEEVGENNKHFKARAKERKVQRDKERAERKKSDDKTRRRRRILDDDDDESADEKKEGSMSPLKPKIRKIEKKLVPVLAKLSVDELMETNTYQRFNTTIETIFENTEDVGNIADMDEDGDVPGEMLIPKYQLHDLCTEAAKLKALGAMESIPAERLVRLLNILEKNIRDGARVSPLADPDDDVDESRLWTQLVMERVQRAVDASHIALNIMTSHNMPKTVYLEDVIDRIVIFMKFQLQNTIYPSFDPVYRVDSKNKTEHYNSSGRKKRGHMKEVREKNIIAVYNKMRELVSLLAELLSIQVLTDTSVLHASTLGVAPFFVEGVSDLQLSALKLVTVIFTKYEKHRRLLLDDILASIARLPSSKRSLRTYRLNSEDQIQMLTALVLQLIQCVVSLPENLARPEKPRLSGGAAAGGEEERREETKKQIQLDADVLIINKYETATRTAANFLNVFLNKCGSKGEEIDYRPLFENFIQDLLATVNKPEWPAAELLLSLLGTLLVGHFSNKSSDMSLRVASIDYLGVVAARLRKDAVNSQCKLSTIDQIIRDIKTEQQKDTEYEHGKEKSIAGLSDDEERTMFLQRVLLDYLAVNGTKDTALGYARHFYLAQWYRDCAIEKTRVGQSKNTPVKKSHKKRVKKKNSRHIESDPESDTDIEELDPDENDNNEQKNSEAYRIIEAKKRFIVNRVRPSSSATKPDVLQTYIDYNSAELISQYLASKRQFSQSFDKYLKQILHVLMEPSIAIRTKAMKCLTMIVEADSSVLARFDMQVGVKHSFLDLSTSVREAAVDLVGKFVLSRPELIDKYYVMLSDRILDTGVSVRKRVIKILKDICVECPDFPKIPEICVKMIRRVNDEEGIRKLVMEVFQNMWFTPVRERPTLDTEALLRKVMNITDVVAASSKDMGLEWFEQLLVSLFKPKEDKDDSTKMLTEPPKAFLTACKQIVDCLIENVLRSEETNTEDDGKPERKGASQRLVACLRTLHLFAKIRPQLLVNHAITLQPYLSLKCQTQGDYAIISSVAHTLELVVPLMEHPSETFLAQLEEDSVKLVLQHDRSVVTSCLSCLGSIVNNVTRNFKLIRDCFKKYYNHLASHKLLYEKEPTNPQLQQNRPFFRRALFTVGLLLRHFNFTDREVIEGLPENIKDQVFETLNFFLHHDDDDIRHYTLSAIGSLCIRHYEFMMLPELKELYHYLLTSEQALVHMRIQVLSNIEIYLQEEEKRMIKQDQEWAKLSKQENLKEMGDVSSGMASTVIQLYLKEILESYIHSTLKVRQSALKVIQLILAQGLVHPVQIVPYLICMSTDCDKAVSHSADKQLQDIEKKYPGFIHMKSQFGIKLSYRLQKIVQNEVAVRGMKISENEFPGALNGFLYTILRNTKQQRRAIVLSFLKQFDENAKTSLSQMLYLADNLAYFTYQVQDEPLFIIHHIDIIISMSGTNLLQSFKEALLPKEGSAPLANQQPATDGEQPIAPSHPTPLIYGPDGQPHPMPLLAVLEDEEDDEEDDETILARLPADTNLLRQYLTASQGFMLLLTLRQHLKDLYGFSDAKISQYSPSEAAKVYEKALNRKSNLMFKPKATLQRLQECVKDEELDDCGRKKLVKDYLDFKQLMLKFDPEDPDEEAGADGTAKQSTTADHSAMPAPRVPNPNEGFKLPDGTIAPADPANPQFQQQTLNSNVEHPNNSVNSIATTPRVPKLTIHAHPENREHRKHRSHKTEKTRKHKKKKRRRISDSSDSGDDCSDPDFMVSSADERTSMYSNSIDPWEPGYGPERRSAHTSDYGDYRSGDYRTSRSPEFSEHRERDHRSPEYRNHRGRDRDRERDRSRDRRDRSREDRDRGYRDRDDRYSRRGDRDSIERDRDRDRERDRDRDRDRSRRDRDRDRDRDRRGKRDERDRDDDHSRESLEFDHEHGRAYGSSMEGVHYKSQSPNNTIMIRGLAQHITENDVRQDILNCGLMPKDIRLIRKKDTGASRGFAFVEFNATQEAARWMEMKQGVLMLQDQYRALMQYSIPKDCHVDKPPAKNTQDWHCVKCGAHNFKRRETCFKCSASRAESEEGGEGSDEISPHPTNTVLLRGLDVLTTEDSVLQAMKNSSSMPIRSIRIGRDTLTNTSRGVCYLEMGNVVDAMYLHTALTKQGMSVDGRKVEITYCKLHQVNNTGGWKSNDSQSERYTLDDVAQLAEYSANMYAKTPAQKAHYLQYYTQYYQNQIMQGSAITLPSLNQTDRVNAAAAVAQSAIQQLQASRKLGDAEEMKVRPTPTAPSSTTLASGRVPAHANDGKTYSVPDVSTYHYDESSGYYYDPSTGLYYDPNSQYYYNSHTQQFLYWDVDSLSYQPAKNAVGAPHVPGATASSNAATATATVDGNSSSTMSQANASTSIGNLAVDPTKDDDGRKKDSKQDKVKVAKKIAKDMERWAKTLNQKKENAKSNWTSDYSGPDGHQGSGSGAADAGYAILEKKTLVNSYHDDEDPASNNGLVAAYGGGSDTEEEIEDVQQEDRQHTDWSKLACLLCKRQFPSKEALVRHQQLSDLHKQNLDNWYQVRGLDPNDPQQRNNKYRDRAKERRAKYGEPEPPQPNKLKEKYLKTRVEEVSVNYEEPTRAGIGSDNVGNKLLQKMGWSEGMGLGKTNQGRTSIIEAERRVPTAGLGAKSSSYSALPGDTYKDCVKKMMYARYQELSDT